jgi:electron transfer flavoprotein-quinone oxidoreductase
MKEKFDVIVVGAGPAGSAAAYTAAKAGLKVLQIERGEYPGSKNVQGAILYSDALERIIPNFRDEAPLERHIIEQRMWVLDDASSSGGAFRSADFDKPPYNRYTIIRAQFDKWFASKVREAGALQICETTVESLLLEGNQVVGVKCDRAHGEVLADVVILADGVNSTLAHKAGFNPRVSASNVALAVKEILFLPRETIEARFNLKGDAGVVIEMLGSFSQGMMGTGFLYTNKDSITIGVGCVLEDWKHSTSRMTPYEMLERTKRHPTIAALIEGGEMKEYAAHLIPEGGYYAVPKVHGNGWLIAGDSGGFVNSVHREGSNQAMTTGQLAAETVIEAKKAGAPMTEKTLKAYRKKVEQSYVMKDLHKYRDLPNLFDHNPQFFSVYPGLINQTAKALLTVDGVDKKTRERALMSDFKKKRSLMGLFGDAFKVWRAIR